MKTSVLRIILGDQLSLDISSLQQIDIKTDQILMCEVAEEAQYVKHHKKKIAFIFSAMRHFALLLAEKNIRVEYIKLDNPHNTGSFFGEICRAVQKFNPEKVIVTHPGEYRVLMIFQKLAQQLKIPVEIYPDTRFLVSEQQVRDWAQNRSYLRMEYFYRKVRIQYGILMSGTSPIGGQWNFDKDNRKAASADLKPPPPYQVKPDNITEEVLALVENKFTDHFGDLYPFHFAVTRKQALKALDSFIQHRLADFGPYQDAMLEDESWMFHSHLSFYLNCGLLMPLECIKAAENAYLEGLVTLNSAEGFIRQIAGWREFIRGIYWLKMPEYTNANFFNAKNKLPHFFWDLDTKLNCLKQCLTNTKQNAYAHHIQRLMVIGNFALLTGLDPAAVSEWYLLVYADAYEWVELPNVYGMALFADGGLLASKPYIASGNYIHKMSNYCQNCHYNVKEKTGHSACPFNYLYWNFIGKHRDKLATNPRLSMAYRTYDRMDIDKKQKMDEDSENFLNTYL